MPVSKTSLGEQSGRLLGHLGKRVAEFFRAYWIQVAAILAFFLLMFQAWEWFDGSRRSEITFVHGSAVGASADDARTIASQQASCASHSCP